MDRGVGEGAHNPMDDFGFCAKCGAPHGGVVIGELTMLMTQPAAALVLKMSAGSGVHVSFFISGFQAAMTGFSEAQNQSAPNSSKFRFVLARH